MNRLVLMAALSGFLIASTASAQTPEVLNPPVKTAKKKAKKAKNATATSGSKAKFVPGSQETNKQRSTRLTRECKGQVDAGACSGYTR